MALTSIAMKIILGLFELKVRRLTEKKNCENFSIVMKGIHFNNLHLLHRCLKRNQLDYSHRTSNLGVCSERLSKTKQKMQAKIGH